jgi:hypothetical protein
MTTLSMLKIRAAIVVAALAIVPVSQALQAQGLTQLGKVTVPFAFEAGTAHFEPVVYTIIALMNSILSIRGVSNSGLTMVMRDGGYEQSTVSKLIFRRFGNRYFLREVWTQGNSGHLRCPESKAEWQAERAQQASNRASIAAHTNIEIALLEAPR